MKKIVYIFAGLWEKILNSLNCILKLINLSPRMTRYNAAYKSKSNTVSPKMVISNKKYPVNSLDDFLTNKGTQTNSEKKTNTISIRDKNWFSFIEEKQILEAWQIAIENYLQYEKC